MPHVKKAVLIKPSNIEALSQRFGAIDDAREPLVVGYFLIADFDSQDEMYELVTPGYLREHFVYTGKKLQNDFLEVVERESVDGGGSGDVGD